MAEVLRREGWDGRLAKRCRGLIMCFVLYSSNTLHILIHFSLSCIGEGNGNPLQCSCLENPRDRGAWWAAVYGGRTESDTTEAT